MKKSGQQLSDIYIFGSAARQEASPNDIDVAVVFTDKRALNSIRDEVQKLSQEIHFNWILEDGLLDSALFPTLIEEGFSIRRGKYLREVLGYAPFMLFSYSLAHLPPSSRVRFSYALHGNKGRTGMLKMLNGESFGKSAVRVPLDKAREFKDFLEQWEAHYQALRTLVSL